MARIREQRALVRYLHAIIDEIIADPTYSRNDAVQFLRDRTVGIDQADQGIDGLLAQSATGRRALGGVVGRGARAWRR